MLSDDQIPVNHKTTCTSIYLFKLYLLFLFLLIDYLLWLLKYDYYTYIFNQHHMNHEALQ